MRRIFGNGSRGPMRRARGRRKINLMMCSCPLRKSRRMKMGMSLKSKSRRMKMGTSRKGQKMRWIVKVKVRKMIVRVKVMKLMNNSHQKVNRRVSSQVHNKLQKKLCTKIKTIESTLINTVKMVSQHQNRQ